MDEHLVDGVDRAVDVAALRDPVRGHHGDDLPNHTAVGHRVGSSAQDFAAGHPVGRDAKFIARNYIDGTQEELEQRKRPNAGIRWRFIGRLALFGLMLLAYAAWLAYPFLPPHWLTPDVGEQRLEL